MRVRLAAICAAAALEACRFPRAASGVRARACAALCSYTSGAAGFIFERTSPASELAEAAAAKLTAARQTHLCGSATQRAPAGSAACRRQGSRGPGCADAGSRRRHRSCYCTVTAPRRRALALDSRGPASAPRARRATVAGKGATPHPSRARLFEWTVHAACSMQSRCSVAGLLMLK